MLLALAELVIV